jgi:hypothetical protein
MQQLLAWLRRRRVLAIFLGLVLAGLAVAAVGAVLQLRVAGDVARLRDAGETRQARVVGETPISGDRLRVRLAYEQDGPREGWLVCGTACPAAGSTVEILVDPAEPGRFATPVGKLGGDDGEKRRYTLLSTGLTLAALAGIMTFAELRRRPDPDGGEG